MQLKEWADKQPRGVLKRIEHEAKVGWTTIARAMRGEHIGRYETARRISEFTGGVVSIEELCGDSAADGCKKSA